MLLLVVSRKRNEKQDSIAPGASPAGATQPVCLRLLEGTPPDGRSRPRLTSPSAPNAPWQQSSNVWREGTSLGEGARRLRGMTTILRKYHSVARCTLLGEMIEDTAHRYYYRPHLGTELTFVDKELPAIHLTPCPACPDWPASQQRGSAAGTNSR